MTRPINQIETIEGWKTFDNGHLVIIVRDLEGLEKTRVKLEEPNGTQNSK